MPNTKVCAVCRTEKGLAEFTKGELAKKSSTCRACRSACNKAYVAKNKEVLREKRKKYYTDNRDELMRKRKSAYAKSDKVLAKELRRIKATEILSTPPTEKRCPKCSNTLPISSFYLNRSAGGYQSWCGSCLSEYRKKQYREDPEFQQDQRDRQLRRQYGLTLEDYETIYSLQKGCCRSCGDWKEQLCVDHCHNTDKVRGLLCHPCNIILGLAKDRPHILEKAAAYLERTTAK